jgi:hypothetical protein
LFVKRADQVVSFIFNKKKKNKKPKTGTKKRVTGQGQCGQKHLCFVQKSQAIKTKQNKSEVLTS